MSIVETSIDPRGVATITLNRPGKHNALNDETVAALQAAFKEVGSLEGVRVVVLTGAGASFCAGADIGHMRSMMEADEIANRRDALAMAECFRAIDECPRPVVAKVQGNAFGGGLGVIAAVDIALASEQAKFALTEVRLGIIPATISPFVVRAIGARQARRLFLTGETFDAREAQAVGLVHHVVDSNQLDEEVERRIGWLLQGGPHALSAAKNLVRLVMHQSIDEDLDARTAQLLASLRISPEGQEGLGAFLQKRPPDWVK